MGVLIKKSSFSCKTCINARTDVFNEFSREGPQESALPLSNHLLKHPHIHGV